MASDLSTLREVLKGIMVASTRCWLYLPEDEEWTLDSRAVVLESEEVSPGHEDDPNAGIPALAIQNKLVQVLPVGTVQDVVTNAREQRPKAAEGDLLTALLYYYDNDAFIDFPKRKR